MADIQPRRRKLTTYGTKSARRRHSEIDDIFSSPRPATPARPVPQSPLPGFKKPSSSTSGGPVLNGTSTVTTTTTNDKERHRSTAPITSKDRRRNAVSTNKSTRAVSTTSDVPRLKRGKDQAAEQLQKEAMLTEKVDERGVYDIPTSDEDQDYRPPLLLSKTGLKRKRAPQVGKPKAATTTIGTKKMTEKPVKAVEKTKRVDDMPPAEKKSRGTPAAPSSRKASVESSAATVKISSGARITKPADRKVNIEKGQKLKKSVEKDDYEPTAKPLMKTVEKLPPRPRVTRSRSRAISEEPTPIFDPPLPVEKPREVGVSGGRRGRSSSTEPQLKKTNSTKVSSGRKRTHGPKFPKTRLESIAEPSAPTLDLHSESAIFCDKEMVAESAIPKHMSEKAPLLSSPTRTSFLGTKILDSDSDSESPPPPPRRKRLIDNLGVDPNQPPRKKSRTPSSGSDSEESDMDYNQYSHVSTAEIESQNQHWEEMRRQAASQEAALRNMGNPAAGHVRGNRVTYARQRSYLAEEADELALLHQPLPSLSSGPRRRLANAKLGSEEPEGDSQTSVTSFSAKTKMQSIHELRAAGESRRFADEVDELFGDIDTARPTSTRRMGYYSFAEKMRDKAFCLKFRSQGFDETLVSSLKSETDDVICFAMAYIAHSLLTHDPTQRIMLQLINGDAMHMLLRMLSSTRDMTSIARDRKTNMSRIAQDSVRSLRGTVLENRGFAISKDSIISPQLLALKVLDGLIRRARQSANVDDFLPDGALSKLVAIIKPFTALLNISKTPMAGDISILETTLSILESYSIGDGTLSYARLSASDLTTIATLFPTIRAWNAPEKLGQVLLLTLRLAINIANHSTQVCAALSQPILITSLVAQVQNGFDNLSNEATSEKEHEENAQGNSQPQQQPEPQRLLSLDLTILSLGLLLNFSESSASARDILLKHHLLSSPDTANSTETSTTLISILTTLFLTYSHHLSTATSISASHTNVALGYLSILLGELVCVDDHIRYHVRGRLRGGLRELVEPMEIFVSFHRKVDGLEFGEAEVGEEVMGEGMETTAVSAVTEKFEGVVRRLKTFV
ncbi:hypothetical protein EX30DRAFT_360577 [Ascodesmis nigricans]|uniref:Wings apart-like protein C-terminal domain-containing protein n=1 Tax=Ascodesmis nigricans TaxID=341454 RepID=A0A4S2N628_9PEZI|nr:hypothetical protein EX30DRAFT_360577 [Ascodesmis nigricans]